MTKLSRCIIAFSSLLLLALLACAHGAKAPVPGPAPDPPPPTLDQYGGRTDIACSSGAKGYFYTQKVGAHWYFCDPLGNAFVAMAAANMVTNGNPTFDCTRQSAGTATSVSWSSGSATYTFPTPLPSAAVVNNSLVTTGFSPSGYNVTDKQITAVNSGAGTVTIAMTSNPGAVTTEGTGAFDIDVYPIYARSTPSPATRPEPPTTGAGNRSSASLPGISIPLAKIPALTSSPAPAQTATGLATLSRFRCPISTK